MICESSLRHVGLQWKASRISKLKALMGFRLRGEVFFSSSFFVCRRCEMGDDGWWSGSDCVLSHCSSLTDIWKVPLGKNTAGKRGLIAEFLSWRCQLAAASKSRRRHRVQLPRVGGGGGGGLCTHGCIGYAWGMWRYIYIYIWYQDKAVARDHRRGPPVFK